MIIVNTTFVLHPSIEQEVLSWIKNSYDRSAQSNGSLGPGMLTRIISDATPADGEAYALHINFPDLAAAQRWNEGVGNSLRSILAKRHGENALTFHTYLEVME